MNKTFTTQDGFTWYIIEPRVAQILVQADYPVYKLWDDESDSLIEDTEIFDDFNHWMGFRFAIEEPADNVVYTLCGKTAVEPFMRRKYDKCHDAIFAYRTADIHFFSLNAKPKEVINVLSYCDATCYIDSASFLRIIGAEQKRIKYPFDEGDTYYVIENGSIVQSIWDDVSEQLYVPHKRYYSTLDQAIKSPMFTGKIVLL
jgi:hypothetical protein